MPGKRELMQHVYLQWTEALAERNLLLGRNAKVTKHEDVMIQMRTMNAREVRLRKRLRQIQADDFSA